MVSIAYRAIIIQFFHKPESEAWINSNLETHRLEDYIPIFFIISISVGSLVSRLSS